MCESTYTHAHTYLYDKHHAKWHTQCDTYLLCYQPKRSCSTSSCLYQGRYRISLVHRASKIKVYIIPYYKSRIYCRILTLYFARRVIPIFVHAAAQYKYFSELNYCLALAECIAKTNFKRACVWANRECMSVRYSSGMYKQKCNFYDVDFSSFNDVIGKLNAN